MYDFWQNHFIRWSGQETRRGDSVFTEGPGGPWGPMLSCVHVHEWGRDGHLASSLWKRRQTIKKSERRNKHANTCQRSIPTVSLTPTHPPIIETMSWQSTEWKGWKRKGLMWFCDSILAKHGCDFARSLRRRDSVETLQRSWWNGGSCRNAPGVS